MIKLLVLLSLIWANIYAEISLEYLNNKPKSRTKDFMIWQYLNQNITPTQADAAYAQVDSTKNNKIFYRYAKKTNKQSIKYKSRCKKERNLLKIFDYERYKVI